MVASGALAFDGKGWPWEWPFRWCGLIDPALFTIVGKSITYGPIRGNLRWWHPWTCVRPIKDGTLNKVGLTNPGFRVFLDEIVPTIKLSAVRFVPSFFGIKGELLFMTQSCNHLPLVAYEINASCPNSDHTSEADAIIDAACAVCRISRRPVILKLSAQQNCCAIAQGVKGYVAAISMNSVPWGMVYPERKSPFAELPGPGGGGVSGKAAQALNWKAVREIKEVVPDMPVIAPSIWDYRDIVHALHVLRADAVSFGAIHLKHFPLGAILPTRYVRQHIREYNY
jgi:dihydroorotate dehydrogenase